MVSWKLSFMVIVLQKTGDIKDAQSLSWAMVIVNGGALHDLIRTFPRAVDTDSGRNDQTCFATGPQCLQSRDVLPAAGRVAVGARTSNGPRPARACGGSFREPYQCSTHAALHSAMTGTHTTPGGSRENNTGSSYAPAA